MWVFDRVFLLKNTLKNIVSAHLFPCSYFFWFQTSIFDKVWSNPIFLAENLTHGSQKNMTKNVNTFAFISCQILVVDHSKTSSFAAVKTCCEILLCNSITIVHYFWKTKILNLKNFVSFWPIFLHDNTVEKLEFHIQSGFLASLCWKVGQK